MRLFTRRRSTPAENCLADFTFQELQDAAAKLDAGDSTKADALCARAGDEHGRCVAMAILHFTADASAEGGH